MDHLGNARSNTTLPSQKSLDQQRASAGVCFPMEGKEFLLSTGLIITTADSFVNQYFDIQIIEILVVSLAVFLRCKLFFH
jgi:hypothetical protein